MMWAKVTWRYEGLHHFPEMPAKLDHVAFLGHEHRHEFHCTVWVEVKHDNRDIEYIDLKRALKAEFGDNNMNHKSCEMVARDIAEFVWGRHGSRPLKVEVLEDGENGALFEHNGQQKPHREFSLDANQPTLEDYFGREEEVDF
jgi:hypothetical protein